MVDPCVMHYDWAEPVTSRTTAHARQLDLYVILGDCRPRGKGATILDEVFVYVIVYIIVYIVLWFVAYWVLLMLCALEMHFFKPCISLFT